MEAGRLCVGSHLGERVRVLDTPEVGAELFYLGERGGGELLVKGGVADLHAAEGSGDENLFEVGGGEPVGLAGNQPGQSFGIERGGEPAGEARAGEQAPAVFPAFSGGG
jgi:hypothetical protein